MDYSALHETGLEDIFSIIADGIDAVGGKLSSNTKIAKSSSLARATSGLTLVFPVLCTDTLDISTASMVSKAIERKATSMLQIALSAYNITNAKDAVEHLQDFHTNLDIDTLTVDKFMDIMDSMSEGVKFNISQTDINLINEDCKRNCNYYFNDDINPTPLNIYKDKGVGNSVRIFREADSDYPNTEEQYKKDTKAAQTGFKDRVAIQKSALLDSDVRKANEMQPTLILVNYYVSDAHKGLNIGQQAVAGVKAKLYPIASADIINKLITKHVDSDIILKLVKLSTREISVIKDFILGAEEAKLDALNMSKKNSGSTIFNALERRAGKSKAFKWGRIDNSYKAISTLVITAEEAAELKKVNNFDVHMPSNIIPIMTKLNLLHFVIVDTVSESVAIITDGDRRYEIMPFSTLEKEASDTNYKKIINLITKTR